MSIEYINECVGCDNCSSSCPYYGGKIPHRVCDSCGEYCTEKAYRENGDDLCEKCLKSYMLEYAQDNFSGAELAKLLGVDVEEVCE